MAASRSKLLICSLLMISCVFIPRFPLCFSGYCMGG
jgi:hypothetical protein